MSGPQAAPCADAPFQAPPGDTPEDELLPVDHRPGAMARMRDPFRVDAPGEH
ncbi:hypothetical protein ACK8GG_15880 [Micromonosporaceae bacterium DT55]